MFMAFRYEIIILDRKMHRYIETADSAESFVDAISRVFMMNLHLADRILTIYCRKPRSGDFQYMGSFDGISSISSGGNAVSCRILRLANGMNYYLTDEGFRKHLPDCR